MSPYTVAMRWQSNEICLTQGLRPWSQHLVEKKSEETSRARMPSSGLSITRTCANDTSVASSTPQHDATSTNRLGVRSSFSNVEVHALMSDATNEDSVEKSKVTVGFVWSMAASGDAIQR